MFLPTKGDLALVGMGTRANAKGVSIFSRHCTLG
jgi:hypothetical protein